MSNEIPDFLVFDSETQRLTQRGKDIGKAGVAVLAAWGLRDLFPLVWLLDSSRLPRVLLTEDHAEKRFLKCEGVITWNGVGFDDLLLKKCLPAVRKAYARKRHVDLHAICALLQAGVEPERLRQPLDPDWTKMVPTLREDLVTAGWSLEAVARGTLGLGKLEGPQGVEAVEAWQQGRYSEVASYCIGDVAITRALWLFAWSQGFLVSEERGRVNIPREVLS
jgi:hypothetical protein